MIGISSIAGCLPDRRIPVAELPEAPRLRPGEREVLDRLGIETVIDAGSSDAIDLAIEASRRCLAAADLDGDALDAILLCQSRAPLFLMSSEATRLQEALSARRALAMAVADLGCATVSGAIRLGIDMLKAEPERSAILIAFGSRPFARRRYRHPVTVTGDGGCAFLLTRDAQLPVLDLELETSGRYWDLYSIDYRHSPYDDWAEECRDQRVYAMQLAIESRNRFKAMNKAVLEQNGMTVEDVDHFVMQNLSVGAFDFYEQFFKIRFAEACRANLRSHGHLGSSDIVLNLERGIETGEFTRGDRVLVMNNSPVAAWSSMLVEIGSGGRR
jgi:3-oxoacyl-[acyl-carrier-protein] synthase-3